MRTTTRPTTVSYTHLDVYKRQVSALRSALRESPDVILLGEMRDYETIEVAMTAAETDVYKRQASRVCGIHSQH